MPFQSALAHFCDQHLAEYGAEAALLVTSGNLRLLYEKFGYALAFDRKPLQAIEQDLKVALSEIGASGFGDPGQSSFKVSRFKPDETGVLSVVECRIPTNNGKKLLIELVLCVNGSEGHLTLEQFSAAT